MEQKLRWAREVRCGENNLTAKLNVAKLSTKIVSEIKARRQVSIIYEAEQQNDK